MISPFEQFQLYVSIIWFAAFFGLFFGVLALFFKKGR